MDREHAHGPGNRARSRPWPKTSGTSHLREGAVCPGCCSRVLWSQPGSQQHAAGSVVCVVGCRALGVVWVQRWCGVVWFLCGHCCHRTWLCTVSGLAVLSRGCNYGATVSGSWACCPLTRWNQSAKQSWVSVFWVFKETFQNQEVPGKAMVGLPCPHDSPRKRLGIFCKGWQGWRHLRH